MNIGLGTQLSGYSSYRTVDTAALSRQQTSMQQARASSASSPAGGTVGQDARAQRSSDARKQLLEQLRELRREQRGQQTTVPSAQSIVDTLSGKKDDDKEDDLLKTPENYNFKEVSNKIQRAKTSNSAGRAVLAAKRKVQELKRKLANSDGDSDDLQLALNHAKRIERVAKKKQHNLELEEMVARTRQHDEQQDKTEEAAENMQEAERQAIGEDLSDRQADFDKRETAMFAETVENLHKQGMEQISDETIEAIDAAIEEITESEREMLEQAQEMLESLEIVNPHMSEAKFEKLKTKHRLDENKEIVKADADYFKESMKHQQEKGAGLPGFGGGSPAVSPIAFSAVVGDFSAAPSAAEVAMSSFDMQA